ncbi:hypothetical protein C8R47DRAFT_1267242 [Mycena vitilis]|nr:hypothetical protein C8R47DRAFT_1267242 [Mycena vitilis]
MSASRPAPAPAQLGPFKGLVDDKRSKPDLQAIATALKIPIADEKNKQYTKAQLIPVIVKRLFVEDLTLQDNPTFSGLYGKPSGGKGGAKKTSAEKDAEVAKEQSKPAKALTGANLKLHEKKVAMDPPASFARVGLSLHGASKSMGEQPPSPPASDASSALTQGPPSTPDRRPKDLDEDGEKEFDDEKEVDDEEKKIQFSTKASKGIVHVKFSHPYRKEVPPQEVAVENVSITNSIAPSGIVSFETSLKGLIPAAIQNHSPMKQDRAGRIARTGLVEPTNTVQIGSVLQYLEGPLPKALNLVRTDTVTLQATEHAGEFKCDLFFEPSDTQLQPAVPTALTGSSRDRPQEIAQARAAAAETKNSLTALTHPDFGDAMRAAAGVPAKLVLPTNQVAKIALLNYRVFDEAYEMFQPFKKRGYVIPSTFQPAPGWAAEEWTKKGWDKYRGATFTKIDISHAVGLKKSAAFDNHNRFREGRELRHSKVGKYIRHAHIGTTRSEKILKLERKFDNMDYGLFILHLQAAVKAAEDEDVSKATKKSKSSKKRMLEEADQEEGGSKKKKSKKEQKQELILEIAGGKVKGKGKGRDVEGGKGKGKALEEKEIDSDNLDDADSDSNSD